MIIDAQAIEHLDILPLPKLNSKVMRLDGSLFTYLSKDSRTPFGKRMLKRWTVSPLQDIETIRNRLDAVEELVADSKLRKEIMARLIRLPDVERILTKIYTYSVKSKVKAFYIDAMALNRLDEFYDLLATLKELASIVKDVFGARQLESKRLRQLGGFKQVILQNTGEALDTEMSDGNSPAKIEGIFPDYRPILDEFEGMIIWKQLDKSHKVPEPKKGIDPDFDNANVRVEKIRLNMENYVEEVKKETHCE